MKHVPSTAFETRETPAVPPEWASPHVDAVSRDLAVFASKLPDQRLRLLAAMQILGNLRDFLVADMSEDAERTLDEAIAVLMRRERELPVAWAR